MTQLYDVLNFSEYLETSDADISKDVENLYKVSYNASQNLFFQKFDMTRRKHMTYRLTWQKSLLELSLILNPNNRFIVEKMLHEQRIQLTLNL